MLALEELYEIIKNAQNICVFTGAGISVPSHIPDFRSADGIYNKAFKNILKPEQIISHSFFINYPDLFYDFYTEKMVYPNALPNLAHIYFASLPNVKNIVTQNIDNLHTIALKENNCNKRQNVIELHGSVFRNYCMNCGKFYSLDEFLKIKNHLCNCGGLIKPDVVLYEEALDEEVIHRALDAVSTCDVLIIVGTSLAVYPAASFIRFFKGKQCILINKDETLYDQKASLVIHEDIIKVVEELMKMEKKSL